jgi:preprotein translocase subunit SecY
MSLLVVVIPQLERLHKEGDVGRKKINQYTRYLTIGLSIIQSFGLSVWMRSFEATGADRIVMNPGIWFHFMTVLTLTTGTAFVMWLAEQISERGIGNGSSVIIAAGIIAGIPGVFGKIIEYFKTGQLKPTDMFPLLILVVVVIAGVIIMIQGHRRISVQYAKRVIGRKMYGGHSTYIPIQINQAGVIPIIFASSLLTFPLTLTNFFGGGNPTLNQIADYFSQGRLLYCILYAAGVIFFTYFYTAVIFNPTDVADNMRKHGGFIPGVRPGKSTAEYIERILNRVTFVGAIFLASIALLPDILFNKFHIPFYFGGTSLLIVVGVDLDVMRQIETHLMMRHYEGFVKKGRLRGRGY